jgi:hypothetical protein
VVVAQSKVPGTARAQKLKADEERAISDLGSTPKESSWGPEFFLLFAVGLRH